MHFLKYILCKLASNMAVTCEWSDCLKFLVLKQLSAFLQLLLLNIFKIIKKKYVASV